MGQTSIQWTDFSWNPLRARVRIAGAEPVTKGGYGSGVGHYCEKISSGCANCYSSTMQPRFGMPEFPGGKPGAPAVDVFLDPRRLAEPLGWKKPRKVFVCDMTDLFGHWVPDEWIHQIFDVMLQSDHTFQVLTKRPDRLAEFVKRILWPALSENVLDNIWLGTSTENQQMMDARWRWLKETPALVRWFSIEPLLGPVVIPPDALWSKGGVQWVVVGGESGSNARPCHVEWVRAIMGQCEAAGIPVFVKQMGANVLWDGVQGGYLDGPSNVWPKGIERTEADGNWRVWLRDSKGGAQEEWPEDLRVREFPEVPLVPAG